MWSGLQPKDMSLLYYYLTTSLLPTHHDQELHLASSVAPKVNGSYGRFVTGPPDLADPTCMGKIPHVFITHDGCLKECCLIVYRSLRASVCLFLDGEILLSFFVFISVGCVV